MKPLVIALGAALAALVGFVVWQAQGVSALRQDLSGLKAELQQTRDVAEIQQLQALYQHYMLRGDALGIVGLFANSPDVEIELSNKGVMVGAEAPKRYFLRLEPGAPLPAENPPRPPGSLIMHTSVNPVIRISADGARAKALWLSPGITTLPARGAPPSPNWNYGKYEMSYIKERGEWKILTFRWHQIFYSPSTDGWVAVNLDPGPANPNPDRPSEEGFYNPYRPDATNPFDPAPPVPFD